MTPRDEGPAPTVHLNKAVTPGSEEGHRGLNNQSGFVVKPRLGQNSQPW